MRTLALAGILLTGWSILGQEERIFWGDPVNGVSLGLSVSNAVCDLEKPILVTVHIRNDATTQRPCGVAHPLRCFLSFVVSDDSRNTVAPRKSDCDGSVVTFPLQPGEARTETVDLREYLWLTNGGRLVITAKRLLGWPTFAFSGNAPIQVSSTNKIEPLSSAASQLLVLPATINERDSAVAISETQTVPRALDNNAQVAMANRPTSAQKVGTGIIFVLLALLLAIVWRAIRRRPDA